MFFSLCKLLMKGFLLVQGMPIIFCLILFLLLESCKKFIKFQIVFLNKFVFYILDCWFFLIPSAIINLFLLYFDNLAGQSFEHMV